MLAAPSECLRSSLLPVDGRSRSDQARGIKIGGTACAGLQIPIHAQPYALSAAFRAGEPRRSDSRILWSNSTSTPAENTLLCDLESNSIYALPKLRYKRCHPITISAPRPDAPEEDLYVMSSFPYPNAFEQLTIYKTSQDMAVELPSTQ